MWTYLGDDGIHRIRIHPALPPGTHPSREAAIRADIAAWHRVLEHAILSHPEQWVWHHRRWKSRPRASVTDLRRFSRPETEGKSPRTSTEVAVTR
jgi:lauroyl/myristoyl acyltransferase